MNVNDANANDAAKPTPKESHVLKVEPQAIAARFSACGEYLVAGCFDGRLRRFKKNDEGQFTPLPAMEGHGGWVEAFVHHPDQPTCYSGDSWGGLASWSHNDDAPAVHWKVEDAHDGWIRGIDVDSSGERIATCGLDRKVRVRRCKDGGMLQEFTIADAETFVVRFHPKRNELICGDLRGRIHRWNLETGESLAMLDAGDLYLEHRLQDVGGVRVLTFDATGEKLAAGGTRPKNGATVQGVPTVFVFDYASGERTQELTFGATNHCFVHDIVFHPDGYLMVVTSGTPGSGQVVFQRLEEDAAFYTHTKIPNVHSLSLHRDRATYAVTATNRGSNGNGRRLNKEGEYEGNNSPIHIFTIEAATA